MMRTVDTASHRSFYEVSVALNSARTIESVLQSIVENVAKEVKAKGCAVLLLTPDRSLLFHSAACGLSNWYISKGPIVVDESISGALMGKPTAIFDAATDERIQYQEQAKKEGIASILSVPMMLKGETLGIVRVYTAEHRRFTTDDIYFVGAAANLGAIALENALLQNSFEQGRDTFRQQLLELEWARCWPSNAH